MKNYRSCFIVDVKVDKVIVLSDSQRNRYFIDSSDMDVSAFKKWFRKFLTGVAQTLTVFEYSVKGEGADMEMHVVRFFNTGDSSEQING